MSIINYRLSIGKNQPFRIDSYKNDAKNMAMITDISSTVRTSDVSCPCCKGKVHIYENYTKTVKDFPLIYGVLNIIRVKIHRYKCTECYHTFSQKPGFIHKGTRVTENMAEWIKRLLSFGSSIFAVSSLTGVNWSTVKKIHNEYITEIVCMMDRYNLDRSYRPKYLAVDEFSIHKGHTYATCVMDLETGEVIWVGTGRTKKDFRKFFEYIKRTNPEMLSEVKGFAMDMNASYNSLVAEYLPDVDIVYDRYHVQAQFGRDVLGTVRLDTARKHKEIADELRKQYNEETDISQKREIRLKEREERKKYSGIKGARWDVLTGQEKLYDDRRKKLDDILDEHLELSVCYALKEEMREIFELKDPEYAQIRWEEWFEKALNSGIAPLVKFAKNKKSRLPGLINHAKHGINTGRLEGFNNRIKVAKRTAYGYRDEDYFFTLVRYMSLTDEHVKLMSKMI